jgi:hypothetical protein
MKRVKTEKERVGEIGRERERERGRKIEEESM